MFIVFEGIDGSGKSTQIQLLRQWLPTSGLMPEGVELVVTQEPGGTHLGRILQDHLIAPEMKGTREEWLLNEADRAHHVRTVIDPAIEAGHWVLCDRYIGSTVAYQGQTISRLRVQDLLRCTASRHKPNITFLLRMQPSIAIERIKKRDGEFFDTKKRLHDAALSYQSQSVLYGWEVINASRPILKVHDQCKAIIHNKINKKP